MTEEEWLAGEDPYPLLDALRDADERKLRLFACACCRSVWAHLWTEESYQAVFTAEQFADGWLLEWAMTHAGDAAASQVELYPGEPVYDPAYWACHPAIGDSVRECVRYATNTSTNAVPADAPDFDARCAAVEAAERRKQAGFLRDIFGNPFRPVHFSPSWRTSDAWALAQQMYKSGDFGAMPILADALQDAGCDSDELLKHLRDASVAHVRGCWALDLVLGKS